MRLSKKFLAGTISAALLIGAPSASAVTSARSAYSKPGGIVQTQVDNGNGNNPGQVVQATTPERAHHSNGRLPFTGLDLVLVVAAGGLLLGLGLGMRRLSRSTGVA
jgi:opacity protein-like surface antigen